MRWAIESIAESEHISAHDFPKRLTDNDHHIVRQLRNRLMDHIRYIAAKYNYLGGRWLSIRQNERKFSQDNGEEKIHTNIDQFWNNVVKQQLKSNQVHFDSVAITRKVIKM